MWRLIFVMLPEMAMADSLVATRTIRAQSVVQADDVTLVAATIPGALTATDGALGLEARVAIYAGRPIKAGDLGPPTLLERPMSRRLANSFTCGSMSAQKSTSVCFASVVSARISHLSNTST